MIDGKIIKKNKQKKEGKMNFRHILKSKTLAEWSHQSPVFKGFTIGLLVSILFGILGLFGFFELGDAYLYQATINFRHKFLPQKETSPIIIAEISQNTIAKFNSWPINRSYLAKAITNLTRDGAKVIAIDLDFTIPRQEEDDAIATALHQAAPTVLASIALYPEQTRVNKNSPMQLLMPGHWPETSRIKYGMANITASTFGVKKLPLFLMRDGKCFPSFSLQVALFTTKNANCSSKTSSIFWGGYIAQFPGLGKIPLDLDEKYWINFAEPREGFTWIPFEEILSNKSHKKIIKDKIVLIGATAPIAQDLKITPVGGISGVEIQANVIRSLLINQHIYPVSGFPYTTILILIGASLGILLSKRHWSEDLPVTLLALFFACLLITGSLVIGKIYIPGGALFFTIFGTYLGVSLSKNANIHEILETKGQEASHIEGLWQWTGSKNNLLELVSKTFHVLQEWLNVSSGGILIYRPEGKYLEMLDSFGIPDSWHRARLPGQNGFSELVWNNNAPLLIPSTHHDSRASGFERSQVISSFVAVPLTVSSEVYGILWVGSPVPYGINEEVLKKLELVGRPLTWSLEHYLNYNKEKRLYQSALQALNRSQKFYLESNKSADKANNPDVDRIARYATLLAKRFGMLEKEIDTIKFAALSLDVAGIGSFEYLARKPERITPTDWQIILPTFKAGLKMLEPLTEIHNLVPILGHIFEQYDGKGFPDKLSGKDIPIGSRILAIANTFERLSKERPYGSVERALKTITALSGLIFDPELVRLFVGVMTSEYMEQETVKPIT